MNRAQLDALVYLNIRGRHLYPAPEVISDASSVAALWPRYTMVISVTTDAPAFLRERFGRVVMRNGKPWES